MVFLVRLLVALVLVGLLLAVAPETAQLAKPNCPDHCGNVSIPYPFGLQSDCSLNKDFLIDCKTTDSTPPQKEAFLWDSNIKVINISMDGKLQIRSEVSQRCFSSTAEEWTTNWLRLSKFTVSSKNKFTVVGCDSYAYLLGSRAEVNYSAGCMSICDSIKSVYNKSCAGSGCCQIEIPDGLYYTNVTAKSFNSHKEVRDFNPCTYAFVVEDGKFNFSSEYLGKIPQDINFTMLLEWSIEKAGDHKLSSACKDYATSYNLDNVSGYRCKCKDGYEGNPYIGCRDIDECARQNNCSHKCINTDGNYTCSCPKGYHGDGRKDGQRCTASQFPLMKIIIGVGIGVTVLFVATSWLYLVLKQRKLIKLREKFFRENGGFILRQKLSGQQGNPDMAKIFTDEELKKATNNFEESTVVGKGGFGTVYRGILADNREVAIKKSISVDQNQIEQFINEVVVLSQINHRNVVKLLGCCLENRVPLLVYEFISNGTVFDCMHNQRNASALSWELRLRIAAEMAGALSYLHSAASVPIIHRDVKTTNMLLDANYTAKLSDFGASRLVPLDETQLSTMVQGTLGYLDPEYLRTNQLTEKSDVYSFGVVLAELLTGKKALSFDRPEEERSLAAHFLTRVEEGKLFEILEKHIVNEGNEELVMEVARLAKRCLNLKGDERPSMKEVAMELEGLHMMNMHPWAVMNAEETEFLLTREESNASNNGDGFTASSAGIDSMKDNLLVSVGGGR